VIVTSSRRTDDDCHDDARHVRQPQAVGDHAECEHREQHAAYRAGAAGNAHAAEDHHRDRFQLPAQRDIGPRAADAPGEQHRRQAGHRSGQHEQRQAVAIDPDP
jgi:hypothetical protein